MIDEKKLIESINNQIKWMNNEAKTKSDEDVMAGLKVVLALIDEQDKVGKWIPCSEMLPEKNGMYLVTQLMYSFDRPKGYGYPPEGKEVDYVEYQDGWRRADFYEVLAWQPLPEPYKEESNG